MSNKLFTSEELTTIHELAAAAEAVEERMHALDRHELKTILQSAGERYACGELDLPEAVLSVAGVAVVDQNQVAAELRHSCKIRLREIYAAADDFIRIVDNAAAEAARIAAAELERTERDIHTGHAGLPPSSFEPSAALQALRRRHAEALQYVRRTTPPSKADFNRLITSNQ